MTDCPNPAPLYQNPTFDTVYGQVEFYGRIFDRQDEAAAAVAGLRGRVAKVQRLWSGAPRTAAAVFVPLGGGQLMKFDYMDPPTPLSVEGLEKVAEAFRSAQ